MTGKAEEGGGREEPDESRKIEELRGKVEERREMQVNGSERKDWGRMEED